MLPPLPAAPSLALAAVLATGSPGVPAAPAAPVPAAPAGTGAVAWGWPLDPVPRVAERFDPPESTWGAGHRGVDLATDVGAPVRAAGAGRVLHAGPVAGRGVVSVVHADGLRTTYEPVAPTVSVGDVVARGDVVGHVTAAPGHCLPATCLHWGLLRGETYLDPLALVGAVPVRLLPLRRGADGG